MAQGIDVDPFVVADWPPPPPRSVISIRVIAVVCAVAGKLLLQGPSLAVEIESKARNDEFDCCFGK